MYTSNYALLIENKGSGMSLIQELKREGIRAIAVKPDKDKVMRMNAHTARIEAGYVHLRAGRHGSMSSERDHGVSRLLDDDQIDALSQALDRAFTPRATITWGYARGHY